MQIVVNIPKKIYNELKTVTVTHAGEAFAQKLIKYITNGTPLKQEPCEDCLSRKALYNALYERFHDEDTNNITDVKLGVVRDFVKNFPSVTPQEPCDKCEVGNPCLYCKHEFEPQESEEV